MKGWSQATDALSIVKCNFGLFPGNELLLISRIEDFPWGSLPKGSLINDLGGGNGSVAAEIAKQYPHLRFVLQDQPAQLELAKTQYWPENCPQALKEGRIEFKVVDFLNDEPVAGCDVYYVRDSTTTIPKVLILTSHFCS